MKRRRRWYNANSTDSWRSVSVKSETYEKLRVAADQHKMSANALIGLILVGLVDHPEITPKVKR